MKNSSFSCCNQNKENCLDKSLVMMMMMNCFCGMVDRRKAVSLISSRDHCQRFSPSWISDTPQAGFEPAQNLSSGFVEWRVLNMWNMLFDEKLWGRIGFVWSYFIILGNFERLSMSDFSYMLYVTKSNVLIIYLLNISDIVLSTLILYYN